MHLDQALVAPAGAALDPAGRFAARDQRHHAVVLRLQTLGQLGDAGPAPARKAAQLQQQLVLLRGAAVRARQFLAGAQEAPELVAEVRQQLDIGLAEAWAGHARFYITA